MPLSLLPFCKDLWLRHDRVPPELGFSATRERKQIQRLGVAVFLGNLVPEVVRVQGTSIELSSQRCSLTKIDTAERTFVQISEAAKFNPGQGTRVPVLNTNTRFVSSKVRSR